MSQWRWGKLVKEVMFLETVPHDFNGSEYFQGILMGVCVLLNWEDFNLLKLLLLFKSVCFKKQH